jgi:hypothetical protein
MIETDVDPSACPHGDDDLASEVSFEGRHVRKRHNAAYLGGSGRCLMALLPELIHGIEVGMVSPGLGYLAVTDVEDMDGGAMRLRRCVPHQA